MVLSMDRWVGKVAVVTGASAGIGAAIAERLVEEGLQVVGLARRSHIVEELAKKLAGKKGKLHAVQCDMTKESDIVDAFNWTSKNLGPVHILINNAGILYKNTLIDGDTAKWRATFDTNVIALCIATREAVKIMREHEVDGHVVHINSRSGHYIPGFPGVNVYPASKFAVTALTETLRQEFNGLGSKIKVTSISPGPVTTDLFTTNGYHMDPNRPHLQSEDVADSVLYALSTPPHVQVHELLILPVGSI